MLYVASAAAVCIGVADASGVASPHPPNTTAFLAPRAASARSGGAYWWQRGGWNGRTVNFFSKAPDPATQSAEDLKTYADQLKREGSSVLTIQAVYDSGLKKGSDESGQPYKPGDLWGGLAINDLGAAALPLGDAGVSDLVSHVHAADMKIMTWFNPSYVWTGSDVFKAAEADMHACRDAAEGALSDCLPEESPARYFKWSEPRGGDCWSRHGLQRPKDAEPLSAEDADADGYTSCQSVGDKPESRPCWVYDPAADRCYMSTWASQPSGDFASDRWVAYVQQALAHWINQGIDGFVLDAPNMYIWQDTYARLSDDGVGAVVGATTAFIREHSKGKSASFSETYMAPGYGRQYQVDATLAGEFDWAGGTAIAEAILGQGGAAANATVDDGFTYVDAAVNEAYRTRFYAIAWQRPVLLPPNTQVPGHEGFYPSANVAQIAITSAGGYFLETEFIKTGWDFADHSQAWWWTSSPWFGEGAKGASTSLGQLYQFMATSDAFRTLSLRAPAPAPQGTYAMIRYDAVNTADRAASGDTGVFAANLLSTPVTYDFHDAFSKEVAGQFGGSLSRPASMHLDGGNFDFTAGLTLPTWDLLANAAGGSSLNCYPGRGADADLGQYDYDGDKHMTLAACFLSCLHNSKAAGGECASVTILWEDAALGQVTGRVSCWGRRDVDAEACNPDEDTYSTFVMSQ